MDYRMSNGVMESVSLYCGDCLDVLPTLEAESVDTVITDPPGGIAFMGKLWDNLTDHKPTTERGKQTWLTLEGLVTLGYLQRWEAGFLYFTVDWATQALRVAKPGAMGIVWAIPRTSDLTKFGLRLAGWEIRDTLYHLFGSGFPKSHDLSKAIDKAAGAEREVVGQDTRPIGGDNSYCGGNGQWPGNGDITAPAIVEQSPREGAEVKEIVHFEVTVTDDTGIESVLLRIGHGPWMAMTLRDDGSYLYKWETTTEDDQEEKAEDEKRKKGD